MRIKVDSEELQIGMFVAELDRPWLETHFLFQGFKIGNEAELDDANRLDVGVVAGLGAKISAAVADVTIDARYTHSLSKPDKDGEVDAYNRSFMVLAGVMF